MANYAIINVATGMVENVSVWDGIESWSPPDGYIAVETTVAGPGWSYIDGEFLPPQIPDPTPEEILASQSAKLQGLTQLAASQKIALTNRISALNDAVELEMATPEEAAELPVRQAQLLEWKRYAVYLGRVIGQDGWPPEVEWPVQPTEGMDLTVSAMAPEQM